MRSAEAGTAATKNAAPPPPAPPAGRAPAQGRGRTTGGAPAFSEAAFEKRLKDCSDRDTLAVLADELRSIEDDDARIRLGAIWEKRDAELAGR